MFFFLTNQGEHLIVEIGIHEVKESISAVVSRFHDFEHHSYSELHKLQECYSILWST